MAEFSEVFQADVERFVRPGRAPRGLKLLVKILSEPGLQFAWLMRAQISLEAKRRQRTSRLVHLLNLRLTGAEFGHGCSVGGGIVSKHPLGLVVGSGTQLGANCTILHNVTFGERRPEVPIAGIQKCPVVGDDCLIGTSAVLLGPISVGDGAKVGAGAVVLHDVPAGATVVGSPARELQAKT